MKKEKKQDEKGATIVKPTDCNEMKGGYCLV